MWKVISTNLKANNFNVLDSHRYTCLIFNITRVGNSTLQASNIQYVHALAARKIAVVSIQTRLLNTQFWFRSMTEKKLFGAMCKELSAWVRNNRGGLKNNTFLSMRHINIESAL